MNIYIAGPFSHEKEREALKEMITIVRKRFPLSNLYIPMEYKVEGDWQKLDGTWNLSNYTWAKAVYESDIKHLNEAELVFALYTGHYCSSGSIWEIGYAKGKRTPVIAYIPKWVKGDMSLMVMNGFSNYIEPDGTIKEFTETELSKYNLK